MDLLLYGFNMGKLRNRVVNTLGIAPRTVKTASRATVDTTKTALNLVLDPFIGLGKTSLSIKDAIHKSFTEGPWYRKLWKAPASLALSPFMAIEGVAETLRGTGVNACTSVRDIIGNTLTNEGNAVKMMGKSEKFKFTTDKLDYKRLSPRNRLASLFGTKSEEEAEREYIRSREKDIKNEENRLKKERDDRKKETEKRWNDRKADQEKSRKERESRRNERKAEQDKHYEAIKQEREAFNKQKDDLNKRISILEQEKKNLESALKTTKTETKEVPEKRVDTTIKATPTVEKKEVASEAKPATTEKTELKQAA